MAKVSTPGDGPTDPVVARARGQLAALARALDLGGADVDAVTGVLDVVDAHRPAASPWSRPRWSGVGDDCSPLEWSLAFGSGGVDLRLLAEAQLDLPSPSSYWHAALALTDDLTGHRHPADRRFAAIAELYQPASTSEGRGPAFALWHGIEWPAPVGRRPPRLKLYLNPAAAGLDATAVVAETYRRLGHGRAFEAIAPLLDRTPPSHVSIDLEGPPSLAGPAGNGDAAPAPRLKLYLRARDTETAAARYALGATSQAGDVEALLAALTGDATAGARGWPRPGFVVLHHVDPDAAAPARTVLNLHVPSWCGDDPRAADRIGSLLARHGLDASTHRRALDALARDSYVGTNPFRPPDADPLAGQVRLQSWVSFQREPTGARVTAYVGLRAHAARWGWGADDPETMWS